MSERKRSFLFGDPWIADEVDCKAQWSGGKNGKYFRCALCGHKFVPGDRVRCQYTNDTNDAGGNPLLCVNCDGPREQIIEAMRSRYAEVKAMKEGRLWWFLGE